MKTKKIFPTPARAVALFALKPLTQAALALKPLAATISALTILAAAATACEPTPKKSEIVLNNPIAVEFGDPFVLKASDGRYYMYGTSEGIAGFRAYSSADLADWRDEGVVYQGATSESWTVDCFWAPEVYERGGRYYMFFSANWRHNPTGEGENFRIGVAAADSPTGPFRELAGVGGGASGPIFDPGYPVIDANVVFDDDAGRVYLYYSRCCYKHPVESETADWARAQGWYSEIEESWIYGVEITADFSGVMGEPVLLLRPPVTMDDAQAEWESRSVTSREVNRRWTEGSFTFRDESSGTWYMMYSANFFSGANYAVGYATADSPMGPFTKSAHNPVLQRDGEVTGTGHCMALTMDDGAMLCVYHARTSATGERRVVFIDRMEVAPDGTLRVHGPTLEAGNVRNGRAENVPPPPACLF